MFQHCLRKTLEKRALSPAEGRCKCSVGGQMQGWLHDVLIN